MSGTALAVALTLAVAVVLGVVTVSLGRQVRRLQAEVHLLAGRRDVSAAAGQPDRAVEVPRATGGSTERAADDLVLTPTPLGPPDVELDLSISRVASVTLAGPLIKVAAFSHGVRRALAEESRMRIAHAFRKELRRQRRLRRKRPATMGPPGKEGGRP